jgi:hypothetical protein
MIRSANECRSCPDSSLDDELKNICSDRTRNLHVDPCPKQKPAAMIGTKSGYVVLKWLQN